MNKTTRITGVDNKIGRNSRTGSTVAFTVDDRDILDISQYFMSVKNGEEPIGKIKKIELVMYSEADMKELDKIASLEGLIKELTDALERKEPLDQPIKNYGEQFGEATGDNKENESTNDQSNGELTETDIGSLPTHEGNQPDLKIDGDE